VSLRVVSRFYPHQTMSRADALGEREPLTHVSPRTAACGRDLPLGLEQHVRRSIPGCDDGSVI
jgi:hypothetical protein